MNDEPRLPVLQSGGAIRPIIPTTFEEAWRIANAVVKAGMAPKGIDTPEKATVAILHGMEVGMPPMMAIQSIAMIGGRPTIWGDGALGLCLSSPLCEYIREKMEGSGDSLVAICTAKRRNDPEPKIRRFSVADAKRAKLWGKAGTWQDYPERMLQHRARSWAMRDTFPDVLKGMGIAEEMRDVVDVTPPKPPSLSQPITASPMPPPLDKQILPNPPKPPSVKNPKLEERVLKVEEPDIVDAETGEVLTPGELLSELDDALDTAKDLIEVETIWNDYDLEARLQTMPQGEEFTGVALAIKRRHEKRF